MPNRDSLLQMLDTINSLLGHVQQQAGTSSRSSADQSAPTSDQPINLTSPSVRTQRQQAQGTRSISVNMTTIN